VHADAQAHGLMGKQGGTAEYAASTSASRRFAGFIW
jgi:hypothetical protein